MKNVIFPMFLIVISLNGCKTDKESVPEKIIPVRVENVEISEITIPILTSGKISAKSEMLLSFKTGGIVEKLLVNEGQVVKKGALLAEINLSEINSKVVLARTAYDKLDRDFTRMKSLYSDSVVTLEQYQNVETALNVAKANLEIANFNLEYSKISAPSNGRIYKKFVEVNQLVSPGSPIILFGSTENNWIVKAGLTDVDISKVRINDKVSISLDSYPNEIFLGKITEIAASANPMNGTFEIELSIDRNEKKIISGMIAKIKIYPTQSTNAIIVPINSLVNANGNIANIYTLSEDRNNVEKISVEVETIIDNKVVIKAIDRTISEVITDGVEYLIDGAKVKVVK